MRFYFPTSLALAGLLGLPLVGSAADDILGRPGRENGPTRVYVAMGLLDVDEIDSAAQSFTANLFMAIRWMDPRLAHGDEAHRIFPLSEVWHPEILFVNQQKIWPTFPEVVYVEPDGEVLYRQRVWGPFSQPLTIHDFPFDSQYFEIRIACADATPDQVEFVNDPTSDSGVADRLSLPDWHITQWALNFDPYSPTGSRHGAASFAFTFEADRYSSNYTLKVILPLVLIVMMSWIVFWVDPREAGTQIGVATTSMLTLIAYRFTVGDMMPPVPYLTRMDYFILGSSILVFAALIQAAMTSMLASNDRNRKAQRIDRVCRVMFPGVFIAIVLYSFAG